MNLFFVTSFGQAYYNTVAKHTLPWIVKSTREYNLYVYYEDEILLGPKINDKHVQYINLFKTSPDLVKFLYTIKDDKHKHGFEYRENQADLWTDEQKQKGYNYRLNAYAFCRKWFSIKCAYQELSEKYENFTLIWLDADVLFYDFIEDLESHLNNTFTDANQCIAYLHRDYTHSECGFIVFKSSSESFRLIEEICAMYKSHKVFDYEEYHDSYVFDLVRYGMDQKYFCKLATGQEHEDVFSKCFLSEYAYHMKGCNKRNIEQFIDELKRQ